MGPQWQLAMCKELGRLTTGYICTKDPTHTVTGMKTCEFICKQDISKGTTATYVHIVANYREQKADPYRVRCTVGGNLIDFPGDTSTKVVDLVTVKILINNILSTPGACAACINIKDFFLNNKLPKPVYIRFKQDSIPREFWNQHNLDWFADADGYIYGKVWKGMYGLPQAGRVADDHLWPCLADAEYKPTAITPGLFKHSTNSIISSLMVDDFMAQYTSHANLTHLESTLRQYYEITVD